MTRLVLVVLALEALLLPKWHQRTGRGPSPAQLPPLLGAGLFLTLALRFAGKPVVVGACLGAAGAAHAAGLWQREKS